jgi:hypothetical protein
MPAVPVQELLHRLWKADTGRLFDRNLSRNLATDTFAFPNIISKVKKTFLDYELSK